METDMMQEEVVAVTEEAPDISQLCRVCANPNEYLIPIFHGEGLEHDLKSKVSQHLPIQIRESDSLPVQLCYQCASTLIAWSDLVEGCSEADEKLRSMLPEGVQCEVILDTRKDLPSTSGKQFHPQISSVTSGALFKNQEEIAASAEVVEEQEVTTMDQDAEAIEPAQQRSMTFRSYQLAIRAQKEKLLGLVELRVVPKFSFKYVATNTDTNEDILEISLDGENNVTHLPIPQATSTDLEEKSKIKECDVCGRTFTRAHDLKRHKLTHINMEALEKTMDEPGEFFIDNFPDIPLFSCEVCNKIFKKKANFEQHRKTHSGERPYECEVCKKVFNNASARNRHYRGTHLRQAKYQCPHCQRWLQSRTALRDHVLGHGEERTKQCPECGDMFKTEACLYQHKRGVHASVLLVCGLCQKMFRRKVDLTNHLATHANEKNHVCDQCGRRFNTRGDLRRHRAVHTDAGPHQCDACGRPFALKRYLTAHLKSVHKIVSERATKRAAVNIDPLS